MEHNGRIGQLAQALKGYARILFWGAMGTGKSTLALELARWFGLRHGRCQVLALDPGSPVFGVPGAMNRGRWEGDTLHWAGCRALCTLDAARFRLPLIQAAGRLLGDTVESGFSGPLVIDPPGVTRGVAGAELLTGLVEALKVDAVAVLVREARTRTW